MAIRSNKPGPYKRSSASNPFVFKRFLLLACSQASRSLVIKLVVDPRMEA